MLPYRGRLALRIARTILAGASLAWYVFTAGLQLNWVTALMAAYAVYSLGALPEIRFDSPTRNGAGLLADAMYFGLWAWVGPATWVPPAIAGYVAASAAIQFDLMRTCAASATLIVLSGAAPLRTLPALLAPVASTGGAAIALAFYKKYLEHRMSSTLRHNVVIRSQAQVAREAERQRIAADFHDGPLQSFISFQMRLEIVKKLMARDAAAAAAELRQLQELCQSQVAELRSFVRSMRPVDEGMSLGASLSRMTDLFQRDTGISATFAAGDFHDPAETEISLEVLQIVREALNNIQKHSNATRAAVSANRRDHSLEITVEDNGSGFPFSGRFSLDELELLRLGPSSVKRRIRALRGELAIESKPGQGAKLEVRIPM